MQYARLSFQRNPPKSLLEALAKSPMPFPRRFHGKAAKKRRDTKAYFGWKGNPKPSTIRNIQATTKMTNPKGIDELACNVMMIWKV